MGGRGRFYVFTESVRHPAAGASGGWTFGFYVFTKLVLFGTAGPFGDPLSGLPERGERATKGLQSRPLETCFDTGERRGDVLRSYEFALVQLTQLSRLRRSAYPLASACCGAVETFARQLQSSVSLRTSAHTGVAIRIPLGTHCRPCKTLRRTDCHVTTFLTMTWVAEVLRSFGAPAVGTKGRG